jgi:anti-anti-sigma factor
MAIKIHVGKRAGLTGATATVVKIAGELEGNAPKQARADLDPVVQSAPRAVVLDLADLTFVNSTGIGLLLDFRTRVEGAGGKVFLTNFQPKVRKAFDIVQALPKQSIFASMEELDAYLAEIQEREDDAE